MEQKKENQAGEMVQAEAVVYRQLNTDGVLYRQLNADEIDRALFAHFIRHQNVTLCHRRVNGAWVIREDPFIDDWTEEDYRILVDCLKNRAMGCVEAQEYNKEHVEKEPYDCQLEYSKGISKTVMK